MNGYDFTERVRKVLAHARDESARLHHEYVGTEHILLGLIREGGGVGFEVLQRLDVDITGMGEMIDRIVKRGRNDVSVGPNLPYTSRAKKVLELAMAEARELNHSYVGTEHILLGLLREERGVAAQVLVDQGVTLPRAREEVLKILAAEAAPKPPDRLTPLLTADVAEPTRGRTNDVDPTSPWATLVRYYAAFGSRDMEEMSELWSRSGKTSRVEPLDGIVSGWADIAESYRRLFAHPARIAVEVNDVSLSTTGAFAFAVALEVWTVEGGATAIRMVQTTRIFHREGTEWRIVHEHASVGGPDQLRAFREMLGGIA